MIKAARDDRRFSASRPVFREDDAVYGIRDPDWVAGDSPRHAVLHKLMSPHLGRTAGPRLAELAREAAARFVDRLVKQGGGDLVAELARPLPVQVISELWGIPRDQREAVAELSDEIWRREPGEMMLPPERIDAYLRFRGVVEAILAARPEPDGVLGALVAARRRGLISESEVVDISVLVPATGFKTTSALVASAVLQLADHPDEQRALAADRRRIADTVEEVLRFDPPVHWLPRVTTTEVELDHGTIPEGDRVLLLLGSANRDEARFDEPDRFDPARAGPRHVAFGFGVHYCVGALVARLTAAAVLDRLFARAEGVELAGPVERIYSSLGEREFACLPVRADPR